MDFLIRPVKVSDAEAMIEYLDIIAGESDNLTFGPGEFNITLDQEIAFLESLQDNNNAIMLLAEADGQMVGNLTYSGGPRVRTRHVGEFGVSVKSDYWGQGIGRALVEALIKWAIDSEYCEKINLKVRDDNYKAIALYRKLGFKVEGLIKRDMKINGEFVDCLFMGLNIK